MVRVVDTVTVADTILIQLGNCKARWRERKEGGGSETRERREGMRGSGR